MHPTITVQRRKPGEFATLYNGEFAVASGDGYSLFSRKRDAVSFGNFLTALFGDRLAFVEGPRPDEAERAAMRKALVELRPDLEKWR